MDARKGFIYHGGDDRREVPPVPIPNTEVKLVDVDNTWLETAWDDRKTPT